jgi:hypothetical protein
VSIMRSKPRKRKSTIWLGSETIRGGPHISPRSRGALRSPGIPLSDPSVPCLKPTYTFVPSGLHTWSPTWVTHCRTKEPGCELALLEQRAKLGRPTAASG